MHKALPLLTLSALTLCALSACSTAAFPEGNLQAQQVCADCDPDSGGGGGYGGGSGGGGTPPPPASLRIRTELTVNHQDVIYPWENPEAEVFSAVLFFEENQGGSWQRKRANSIEIKCYENGGLRDQDRESNASRVDVQFNEDIRDGLQIACDYTAVNNGVTYVDRRVRTFTRY
ncbi:hypothetical protein E7T06_08365 [Deinococcus sp. Arct2-2]|uniref:hypothetical protein n=1 Tax=Deinococcus sp. Arct2-2 TaxID=2568653 RepID=UPI0010A488D0|nr:hypothetical protein [Deinococcus sp. Arct2-2]THF70189.1 hypothetical protein E7T06_08365 [Deinococcus sp. Arct2-2]